MIWSLRLIRVLLVVLLFAFSAGVDASAPQTKQVTQSPATRAIGRKLNQKGVKNFGEVTPTLYRGGLVKAEGVKALKKLGMDVIVDTHANDETEETIVQSLGMKYVAIPWRCPWPHDEVFAKFLKVVKENKGKKIFVHCRLGDDRTGMMVAAYRMADEGWTADEAMTEMKSFGFTRSHHLLCPSLASYEKHFPERLKSSPAFEGVRTKQ
ncbi:MAG: dual specificity protein phosphatase family protein [Candidatus Sulfotelmatobacter sp.]